MEDLKVFFTSLMSHLFTNKKGARVIKMAQWILHRSTSLQVKRRQESRARTTQQASCRNPASYEDLLLSLLGMLTS